MVRSEVEGPVRRLGEPDQHGAAGPGGVEDRQGVRDLRLLQVGGGLDRAVGQAVARPVVGHHPEVAGQVRDLALPEPAVHDRPARHEQDRHITRAVRRAVNPYALVLDELLGVRRGVPASRVPSRLSGSVADPRCAARDEPGHPFGVPLVRLTQLPPQVVLLEPDRGNAAAGRCSGGCARRSAGGVRRAGVHVLLDDARTRPGPAPRRASAAAGSRGTPLGGSIIAPCCTASGRRGCPRPATRSIIAGSTCLRCR